jgi:hypothetical protein
MHCHYFRSNFKGATIFYVKVGNREKKKNKKMRREKKKIKKRKEKLLFISKLELLIGLYKLHQVE